jgi:SAM-dependent methyltransferase
VEQDARHWDERHRSMTPIEARAPEMIERWPDLAGEVPTAGRGLDVACGTGSVTLWLVDRGLEVIALDVSGVAIARLQAAALAHHRADRVDARITDLDDGLAQDLDGLDVIVCQRFRDPLLVPVIVDRLRPGGIGIITVLSAVGAPDPGRFHAAAGELSTAVRSDERCRVVHDHEGDGVAHVMFRRR